MNNTKTTKRALLSSVMAMLICVAMLIGTTFAWFTDSASTAVNKIQAGTLKIALEMKDDNGNWVNAEGETLGWVAEDDREQNEIFWEPGCTYKLPTLKITNRGNLALQFQVLLSGISGDMDLLNALEFTCNYARTSEEYFDEDTAVTIQGSDIVNHLPYELPREWTSWENECPGFYDDLEAEYGLKGTQLIPIEAGNEYQGCDVGYYSIKAHMKEEAGNEYQGKQLNGIAITLVATQLATYEYDSFDFIYDKDAQYPVVITNNTEAQSSIMTSANSGTAAGNPIVNVITSNDITLDLDANGGYYNATVGGTDSETVTIDANGNKITFDSNYRNAINCYGKLTISNAELDSTYKTEGSTWDDYALIFKYHENGANEVVFNNVTFDRQVAIEKGVKATFNNCTINQTAATGDMYALWICAGADVTLNGCIINSINPNAGSLNRAIKIADEYVAAPTLTKLSVAGTTFKSQKKAAVLVTSTAGANIVWGAGNDISEVVADRTNAVWNDADRTAAWDLVTVSGCTKIQEQ